MLLSRKSRAAASDAAPNGVLCSGFGMIGRRIRSARAFARINVIDIFSIRCFIVSGYGLRDFDLDMLAAV